MINNNNGAVSADVLSALELIQQDVKELIKNTQLNMAAGGGDFLKFDFYSNAVINRACALSQGFCDMVQAKNMVCAGALLRLHLDTAARFSAGFLVADQSDFAMRVMDGEQINKMKDRDGKLMTDRYLIDRLEQLRPGVRLLYEQTSGYVHFSGTHIRSIFNGANDGDSSIRIKIGHVDRSYPDGFYVSAIKSFRNVTKIIVGFLETWSLAKYSPELINEMMGENKPDIKRDAYRRD